MKIRNIMLASILAFLVFTVPTYAFAGGDGSTGNPYQISDCDELQDMNTAASSNFILTADIDCTATSGWNGGAGFAPIAFQGKLDGDEHTIDGLFINRPGTDNVGLFSYTNGAQIREVILTNVDVTGADRVGGLVGRAMGYSSGPDVIYSNVSGSVSGYQKVGLVVGELYASGKISHCRAVGTASGTYNVGILAGIMDGSNTRVYNSSSSGTLTATSNSGGLVGFMGTGSRIYNSYSEGTVTCSSQRGGGLVGQTSEGYINNSFSRANVTGGNYMGGLVGFSSSGHIYNSYSTGSSSYRGFLGWNSGGSCSGCFWDTQTSGQAVSACGTGKTTLQMKDVATFTDTATAGLSSPWDFVDNPNDDTANNDFWNISGTKNDGYPYLTWVYLVAADTTPPTITINSVQDTTITTTSHTFDVSLDEPGNCTLHLGATDYINATTGTDINWTLTLVETNYTSVTYTCEDAVGNSDTTGAYWLNVDATAPVITINSDQNATVTTSNQTFNVSLNEAGNCTLHLNDTSYANPTVGTNPLWTENLSDGNYSIINFTCQDVAGNIGSSSNYWLIVDTSVAEATQQRSSCNDDWACGSWGSCINGYQERSCDCNCPDDSDCGTKPTVERACSCDSNNDCDDSNECTQGVCLNYECKYNKLTGTSCDDGDSCTEDDVCEKGTCMSGANICLKEDICKDGWECSEFSECTNGQKTRTCTCLCSDKNCTKMPSTLETCEEDVPLLTIETDVTNPEVGDKIRVTVVDEKGDLVDAMITVHGSDGSIFTLMSGEYLTAKPGEMQVIAEKDGYRPGLTTISAKQNIESPTPIEPEGFPVWVVSLILLAGLVFVIFLVKKKKKE